MKPLALALVVIAVLVGAMFYSAATVNAYTYTGGRISLDTTWTQSDGPYRLTSTLTIDKGTTLTIEPGTIVDLYSYQIYVYGTLRCQGTSDNNIVLYSSRSAPYSTFISFYSASSWNESTGLGSIIENTVLSSVTVGIDSCSPKISSDYFYALSMYSSALSIYKGSSLIVNNAFSSQGNGIYIDNGSPKVSNNFIKAANGYGIQVTNGANAYISSNNITGCSFGVYITNNGNATITQNLITSNTFGINCNLNSTTIEYNTIANNSGYGILGTGAIRYNTIGNNTYGVTISSLPNFLTQNNIANNTVNLRLSPSNTSLIAPNNWWGTTDPVLINQSITVDQSSSAVSFMPTLSSPDRSAPDMGTVSLIPAPTPTPFVTPSPVPSPPPTPTPTYYPWPSPTQAQSTSTPTLPPIEPTSTPTPTPMPPPTPTPTPKIVPGSPLSIGSATFEELLTQLDIMSIAQLVLIVLGIMWAIIISVTVAKRVVEKFMGKTKKG